MTMFSVPKFGLSKEIPSVVVDSFETVGWTVHLILCVVVCYWCDSLGSSKMDYRIVISPCELILGVIAMNE